MLIEFKLGNFRSIREPQTLSMVASSGSELFGNICKSDVDPVLSLVRASVIYGPNAGGKTNLIRAFYLMRQIVLLSAKESQQGETIPVDNFVFDKKTVDEPTTFEVTFIKDKIRYQYGFEFNKNQIFEEWLNVYPHGRMQQWFTRTYDKKSEKYKWKFSKFFIGKKQIWQEATRNNALFISTAVQLNCEQLNPMFSWFQNDLIIIPANLEMGLNKTIEIANTLAGKQILLRYLNIADSSIKDVEFEMELFSEEKHLKNIDDEYKKIIKKTMSGKKVPKRIDFYHGSKNLDFSEESDGTQKFFSLAGFWEDVLQNGKVVIIDELNNSLHPLAVKFLIDRISSPDVNNKNAQLIFTTHDTSLLDTNLFRRDQIWFVEKDKHNSTQLYSLLDFSPRKDEAIGKGYLQGRYGALPYIGEWRF